MSDLSAEIMSCGPYADAAEAPDVPDALEVLGAVELVVDEDDPPDELAVAAAVDGDVEFAAVESESAAPVEVVAAEVPAVEAPAVEAVEAVEAVAVVAVVAAAEGVEPAALEAGAELDGDSAAGAVESSLRWPRPDRLAWRSALARSCRNARKS
jgi:hypothetical protein